MPKQASTCPTAYRLENGDPIVEAHCRAMAQFLQLTALLWAALVLIVESRQRQGSLGRGVLVASVTYSFLIFLLVSASAPPQGALIVAAVLLAHMTLIGVTWLFDRRRMLRVDARESVTRRTSRPIPIRSMFRLGERSPIAHDQHTGYREKRR